MAKPTRKKALHNVFSLFVKSFYIFFVLFLAFSYLLTMPLGAYFFYLTEEGVLYSQEIIPGIPMIVPFGGNPWWEPILVWVGFPFAVGWLFAGLWLIICGCLLFAWYGPNEGLKGGVSKLKAFTPPLGNYLLMLPLLSCMALSLAFFLETLLPRIGVPVGGLPPRPPHDELLKLTNASVTEEITFRLIPLGLVSLLLLVAHKPNRSLLRSIPWRQAIWILALSLLEPAMAKSKLEQLARFKGNILERNQRAASLGKAEVLSVLIFSLVFGLAHYGEWWKAGKVISVFAIAVILGCAYYVYGIAASILLHWFFNSYFTVYYYMSSYFPILSLLYYMVFFLHLFAGFALWAIFLIMTPLIIAPVRTRLLLDKIRGLSATISRAAIKGEEKTEVRTCPRCGAALPTDANFCGICGEKIK